MQIKVDINLELTVRQKRVAAAIAVPALLLGLAAIAYADVPHTWTAGEVLSAGDLNDSFAALDTRLTAVEGAAVTVTPWTAYTLSVTAGATPLTSTGTAIWRRVGDSAQVVFNTTIPTCQTAGQLHWSLPAGLVPDGDLLPGNPVVGPALIFWGGVVSFPTVSLQGSVPYVAIEWTVAGGLNCSQVGNGVVVRASFTVPIQGWTTTN
jgi:hypothetical protein